MQYYVLLKFIHIISATVLLGTGIGTAFFMLLAYWSKNNETIKYTTRHVVLADWIFTAPAVVIQPITGIGLMHILHYSVNSWWFLITMGLYLFIGACWIPVVCIQYRLRSLAQNHFQDQALSPEFHKLMLWWIALGIPAFLSILVIYWLMITKIGITYPVILAS